MANAQHILPNEAVRSPFAHGALVFLGLRDDLTQEEVIELLEGLSAAVKEVTAEIEGHYLASVVPALGPTFFRFGDQPRFGLDPAQIPSDLLTLPALPPDCPTVAGDVALYIVTTAEAVFAQFLLGLARLRPYLKSVEIERGFQRANRRELGGFLDGLRNAETNREAAVFVNRANTDEPVWSDGGSYVAYLKIQQDLERWNALDPATQEGAIGRRKDDGSRLDLPPGTAIDVEGEFAGDQCPANAHIRKVGPRGALHDQTAFLRRGLPFVELGSDATLSAGLQFVSFQTSLEVFVTIFDRWMNNAAFMNPNVGVDALVDAQGLRFLKGGFFFVPPHDDRFIAAGLFDPLIARCRNVGRILVRKKVLDASGQPVLAELGGIGFQILHDGQPVGPVFHTNSQGHARSPEVPIGVPLVIHEAEPPPNFTPAPDTTVTLDCPQVTVTLTNTATQPGTGYAG